MVTGIAGRSTSRRREGVRVTTDAEALDNIHQQLISWQQEYERNKPQPPIGLYEDLMAFIGLMSALTRIVRDHVSASNGD